MGNGEEDGRSKNEFRGLYSDSGASATGTRDGNDRYTGGTEFSDGLVVLAACRSRVTHQITRPIFPAHRAAGNGRRRIAAALSKQGIATKRVWAGVPNGTRRTTEQPLSFAIDLLVVAA
jgi:hypothetical protein